MLFPFLHLLQKSKQERKETQLSQTLTHRIANIYFQKEEVSQESQYSPKISL